MSVFGDSYADGLQMCLESFRLKGGWIGRRRRTRNGRISLFIKGEENEFVFPEQNGTFTHSFSFWDAQRFNDGEKKRKRGLKSLFFYLKEFCCCYCFAGNWQHSSTCFEPRIAFKSSNNGNYNQTQFINSCISIREICKCVDRVERNLSASTHSYCIDVCIWNSNITVMVLCTLHVQRKLCVCGRITCLNIRGVSGILDSFLTIASINWYEMSKKCLKWLQNIFFFFSSDKVLYVYKFFNVNK